MTDGLSYTASDLARHALTFNVDHGPVLAETLNPHWMRGDDEVIVAELIAETCAVGYGGHYGEVTEDHPEGETLRALADHLGPLYLLTHDEAYALLCEVRDHLSYLSQRAIKQATKDWSRRGYLVDLPKDLDHCPLCGRKVTDFDDGGCEDGSGQRWCVAHAMEELAYCPRPRPGDDQ